MPAGWFTQPSPFFEGPLSAESAGESLNEALEGLFDELAEAPQVDLDAGDRGGGNWDKGEGMGATHMESYTYCAAAASAVYALKSLGTHVCVLTASGD